MEETATTATTATTTVETVAVVHERDCGEQCKGKKRERRRKEFSIAEQHQRHIALRVAYLGWDYDGFAAQASTDNTIEAKIHAALRRTCLVDPAAQNPFADYHYSRCGRTDKGVSAFGQVICVRVRSKLTSGPGIIPPASTAVPSPSPVVAAAAAAVNDADELDYCSIINSALPDDIRVLGWAPIDASFNARYDCTYRQYKYYFMAAGQGVDSGSELDVDAMRAAAALFIGEHDFRNFCHADIVNVPTFVRTVFEITIDPIGSSGGDATRMFCLTVRGSGFLWHQVRCMVAVLFLVGRHEEDPAVVTRLLDVQSCPGKPSYRPADEHPLLLYQCGFEPPLQFRGSAKSLSSSWDCFSEVWTSACVRASMMSAFLGELSTQVVSGAAGASVPMLAAREARRKERAAAKGKHKRTLSDEGLSAQTIEQRVAALGPTKRRKFEEKQRRREYYLASGRQADGGDDDGGGE
jgi:tRNA pseudouridine38/39 synthase